jgi:uncharacterized flavoprotein (TIGR03862 family)
VKLVLKFDQMKKGSIAIVGTGPAALMAGTILVENGFDVQFFDHKKAPARKFLVAGHGGFNLTNAEEIASFCDKYDSELIKNAVQFFTPQNFIDFLAKIGIETYVGSSGKIFPKKGIKPIEVLNAWLNYLNFKGAIFHFEHKLVDVVESQLVFNTKQGQVTIDSDAKIIALGGGSWQQTGSLGDWFEIFTKKNIKCIPFESSNSGLVLDSKFLFGELEGGYIKNCRLFSTEYAKSGDIVLTRYGLEGAPAYAMNRDFRNGQKIFIDFKPSLAESDIVQRLQNSKNTTEGLKNLKLSKIAIQWIKNSVSKEAFLNVENLAKHLKSFELPVIGLRPIDEVISTVGGIDLTEIDDSFQLKKMPNFYCIGEMLNWDAPTGGYLIQGAVSTGAKAAHAINLNLDRYEVN